MRDLTGMVRRINFLSQFLVVTLAMAGASPVQAQSGGANSSTQGSAVASQKAKSRHPSRGLTNGIKVHGHWTIETRNPDGKVARHAEFENSLYRPDFLVGLISGEYTWGGLEIDLLGSPGPCSTYPTKDGQCWIFLPAEQAIVNYWNCGTSATVATPQPYCYATLVSSPTWDSTLRGFTGLTLTGQAYADTTTNITSVASYAIHCVNPGTVAGQYGTSTLAPSSCITSDFPVPITLQFTGLTLAAAPNCGGSGQSPCQVPVVAGQTIAVTVQYTFQ